jgi:hypothetical protein
MLLVERRVLDGVGWWYSIIGACIDLRKAHKMKPVRLTEEMKAEEKRAAKACKAERRLQAAHQGMKKEGKVSGIRLKSAKHQRRGPRLLKGAIVRVCCRHGNYCLVVAQNLLKCETRSLQACAHVPVTSMLVAPSTSTELLSIPYGIHRCRP